MNRVFYFEGPDHSGKTTLIESLKTNNDLSFKNGVYQSPTAAYTQFMRQFNVCHNLIRSPVRNTCDVFIDRSFISEVIYGSVLRDEVMTPDQFNECVNELRKINATIILCLPPFEIAFKGWKSRVEDELVKRESQYKTIYNEYASFLRGFTDDDINLCHYDYTKSMRYKNETS